MVLHCEFYVFVINENFSENVQSEKKGLLMENGTWYGSL